MKPSQSMFDLAKHKTAEFLDSCKSASKKVKNSVVAAATIAGATASQAAVTVTNGALSGSVDMAGYDSALAIVIPVTVTILVGTLIIKTIKKA